MAPWGSPLARIEELEEQLVQKKDQELQLNLTIKQLESDLKLKNDQDAKSGAEILELKSKLTTRQQELSDVYSQVEQMQTTGMASSNWTGAATLLEALVKVKETQLTAVKSTEDSTAAKKLSKALCSYHRQLGEVYLKENALARAEEYTQKAYNVRVELLGPDHDDTRFTQKQLCKILRKTGDNKNLTEAKVMYIRNWERTPRDKFSLECGHELGCLLHEQKQYNEAEIQFRRVWEVRRIHETPLEKDRAMLTLKMLLLMLDLQHKDNVRLTTLEEVWGQRSGEVQEPAMLQYATELADIYWNKQDLAKARPVLRALWKQRAKDWASAGALPDEERELRRRAWFLMGYRYARSLMKNGGDTRLSRAKIVLESLWISRGQFSITDNTTLGDCYASLLLELKESQLAEEVAKEAWIAAKTADAKWDLDAHTLHVGEKYARALNDNGKTAAAKDEYKSIFAAWQKQEELVPEDQIQAVIANAIYCGRALLGVLRARGKAGKLQIQGLELEIKRLQQRQNAGAQLQLSF